MCPATGKHAGFLSSLTDLYVNWNEMRSSPAVINQNKLNLTALDLDHTALHKMCQVKTGFRPCHTPTPLVTQQLNAFHLETKPDEHVYIFQVHGLLLRVHNNKKTGFCPPQLTQSPVE